MTAVHLYCDMAGEPAEGEDDRSGVEESQKEFIYYVIYYLHKRVVQCGTKQVL